MSAVALVGLALMLSEQPSFGVRPMPISVTFKFNSSAFRERVASAVVGGLERTGKDAFEIWEQVAPVSNDPRTSGDLRSMFRTPITSGEYAVTLTLNAYARHAKFVEFGTIKGDPAQAPLRQTAAVVMYSVPGYIQEAQGSL